MSAKVSAKEVMANLFQMTELQIIKLEEFALYWFYWLHRGELVTQQGATAAIGRQDPKTVRKYNKSLEALGLVRFEVVRVRGVQGMRVTPLKVDSAYMARIKGPARKVLPKKKMHDRNKKYIPLAELLYTEHKKQDDKFLAGKDLSATFNRWAADIRLLVLKDDRDYALVEKIIKWCQKDQNFWVPNILSGRALREKFAMLYSQYMRDSGKGRSVKRHKKIKGKEFKGADVKGLLNGL